MEVEKPFKCSTCASRFTNEDHLQVHRKRHEMSLNLSKSGLSLPSAADGFVDETPTPTRFIRNCEEVGLFQDLQHVNPFDEQFTKATSATPSTEHFEFSFSMSSKKLPDDTLNTPQVFGFSTSSSSISVTTSGTLSPRMVSVVSQGTLDTAVTITDSSYGSILHHEKGNTDIPVLSVGCTAEDSKVESITPDHEGFVPELFAERICKEEKRKADCCVDSSDSESLVNSSVFMPNGASNGSGGSDMAYRKIEASSGSPSESKPKSKVGSSSKRARTDADGKKKEMLERNRAAAYRSRQRRKQWVSGLESRCQTLQGLLSQAQMENAKLRQENNLLRDELSKHSHCDVNRVEPRSRIVGPRTPEFQPQILKHSTSSSRHQVIHSTIVSLANPSVSSPVAKSSGVPIISTIKPKRGRPRKGCEKRASIVASIPSTSDPLPALKIPMSALPKNTSPNVPMEVEIIPASVGGQPANWIILKSGP